MKQATGRGGLDLDWPVVSPQFCRHNRFVANCPICRVTEPPPASARARSPQRSRSGAGAPGTRSRAASGVRVSRVAQAADDGFRCELVPGLKAAADARRLAGELAFAAARLAELETAPPGVCGQIATETDLEEATWLAFETAYLTPAEDDEDPFAGIRAAHVPWSAGELPALDGVRAGPRTSRDAAGAERTVLAYRAWARRAGSQAAALAGEPAWTPERRFERAFERLALPGLSRAGRYDLLVTLGRLGRYDVRAPALELTDDATTVAAKRVFGIGDKILLERRAAVLAEALALPVDALDLALFNWAAPEGGRATYGSRVRPPDEDVDALGAVLGVGP